MSEDLLGEALQRLRDIETAIRDGRRYYATDEYTLQRWADRYLWQLAHDHLPNVAELIRRAIEERRAAGAAVGVGSAQAPAPRTATRPGPHAEDGGPRTALDDHAESEVTGL